MMKVQKLRVLNLEETASVIDKIQQSINKFGSKPEQNVYYYLNDSSKNTKNMLFDFGGDKLILASYNESLNVWYLFPSGILAPEEDSLSALLQFCYHCLEARRCKKIVMEVEDGLFHQFKAELKKEAFSMFKILNINQIYYWPVIDLSSWDCNLKGKRWRKLRKMKNKFYKNKNIRNVPSMEFSKSALKKIVFDWKQNRKGSDRANSTLYLNFIDNGFLGVDYAMSICLDNEPCSISAGWRIPNTNSFYSSIMLHNYKINGLGEVMYLESLNELKNMKFDSVDLGGSDKDLLLFKQKFQPSYKYKTLEFSIKVHD